MKWGVGSAAFRPFLVGSAAFRPFLVGSAAFRPYLVPRIRAEARTPNMLFLVGVRLFPRFIRLKCYSPLWIPAERATRARRPASRAGIDPLPPRPKARQPPKALRAGMGGFPTAPLEGTAA